MEITSPQSGGSPPAAGRTEGPWAAGARPVLREEPGGAAAGRNLALLPIAEVLSRREAGTVLVDVRTQTAQDCYRHEEARS